MHAGNKQRALPFTEREAALCAAERKAAHKRSALAPATISLRQRFSLEAARSPLTNMHVQGHTHLIIVHKDITNF